MVRLSLIFLFVAVSSAAQAADSPDFAKQIRPLFERTCFGCHGPETQTNNFRLDVRQSVMKGGDNGEPAIVPGNSESSPLVQYVTGKNDSRMPPEDSKVAPWNKDEIALVRAWIDAGAKWPDELAGTMADKNDLWSLKPLQKPLVPVAANSDAASNAIDAFIRAKLSEKKLSPSTPASPAILIRRVQYDLTGLPPTFDEVRAFEELCRRRGRIRAYTDLVNNLLNSAHYGEHWARHWLDVVHYADTHGLDHDFRRPNAWPYRDYLIQSFNEDKPYSQFIREQIAGDVLFPDNPQATFGLGFLAAGPWDDTLIVTVRENTIDHLMGQVLDRDDMVSTVMSTFQGLTVHCARCHNHKFDPITQKEYYALQAVFAGIDRADRPVDRDKATAERRRELLAKQRAIKNRSPDMLASLNSAEVATTLAAAEAREQKREAAWQPLNIVSITSSSSPDGTTFARLQDGSWFVSGTRPEQDNFTVTAQTDVRNIRALRLEVLPDERLPQKGPGRYDNGNFHLSEFSVSSMPATGPTAGAVHVELASALADFSERGAAVKSTIDGRPETFWGVHPNYGQRHVAVFECKQPIDHQGGAVLVVRLQFQDNIGHQIGRFRLSYCTAELSDEERQPIPTEISDLLRIPAAARTTDQQRSLSLHLLAVEVEKELAALPAVQMVYAVTNDFRPKQNFKPAKKPRPIQVFIRGDLNRPGELVSPGTVHCIPELPSDFILSDENNEGERRAALANWLADDRNVLTWRNIVNRVWHYHIGRGIVDTPNDFGHMGGIPSHPELLDWLAVWFRDEARGSLKELHRLILSSDTYQQACDASETALTTDADNRYLSHMNRRRLSAEEIRDSLLALGERLDLTRGGPPVLHFHHRDDATFNAGGNPAFIDYQTFDPDDPANRRRSIYRFIFRTLPDPLMDALDCPDGGALTPVRTVSTTPLQALALLNNPFVIRQCEHISGKTSSIASDVTKQVEHLCQRVLLRQPTKPELADFVLYAQRHGLANLCQILVNSNEFLHVD
jgi:hypothetical protein